VRTPKEWTETCRECGGAGTVHKRESFSLWTPDEYEQTQPIDAKHDAPKNAYVCTVSAGASLFAAVREGVELARLVERPVAFVFNGLLAICRAGDDPKAIADEWRNHARP
jgi:hypothetical protein